MYAIRSYYGIFIGLDGGIDGLVHLSDISWDVPGEEAVRNYKKGQEIEAAVLAIDSERERISLGIKQLEKDPFSNWLAANPKNSIVTVITSYSIHYTKLYERRSTIRARA